MGHKQHLKCSHDAHGLKPNQDQPGTQQVWQHFQVLNPSLSNNGLIAASHEMRADFSKWLAAMPMNMNLAGVSLTLEGFAMNTGTACYPVM